jgi:hypothetical protein
VKTNLSGVVNDDDDPEVIALDSDEDEADQMLMELQKLPQLEDLTTKTQVRVDPPQRDEEATSEASPMPDDESSDLSQQGLAWCCMDDFDSDELNTFLWESEILAGTGRATVSGEELQQGFTADAMDHIVLPPLRVDETEEVYLLAATVK